jgi:hypothetical protein
MFFDPGDVRIPKDAVASRLQVVPRLGQGRTDAGDADW